MNAPALNTENWDSARRLFRDGGLSVLLPCYTLGRGAVSQNLTRLHALLDGKGFPFTLIPIDDGSPDDTAEAIRCFAETHPESCTPCLLPENRGKGAALLAALPLVKTDHVLLLDGDLDLDPEILPAFCDSAESTQADCIIGSKRHPLAEVAYPWHRRFFSALYHALTGRLLGPCVSDTQSGMKLLRRTALTYAADRILVKRFAFDLELLTVLHAGGFSITEAPVRIRNFGNKLGCLTLPVIYRTLVDTLAVTYRARILDYYRTLRPLPPMTDSAAGPKFSLIVACPGDSAVLRKLIQALMEQTYRNFEVIFLPDRLLVRPEANFTFRILATGGVRPAKKRNMGADAATGNILVFIDDDAYPGPDWLAMAAARFCAPPEDGTPIDAIGGPGLTPPEDPLPAQLSGIVFASPLVSGNFRYRYFIQGALRRVEDFPSCNLFVRKAAFDAIGGFREDFWPGEDTLLCADLQLQGYTLWYDPQIVVYHHRRPLFGPHLRQVGRYALHRGYFARRIGLNSRRISYLLPSLFLLGLLSGPVAAWFLPVLLIPYITVVGLYLMITLGDALLEAPKAKTILPLWIALIATHLRYGFSFIVGVFSRRMPCGVLPFDHR